MKIDEQSLKRIIAQSTPLFERLGDHLLQDDSTIDNKNVARRMNRWREVVAERFTTRLALDGLDEQTAGQLLCSVRLQEDTQLPAWVEALQEALEQGVAVAEDRGERRLPVWGVLDPEKPLPFEEVCLPFLMVAHHRLRAKSTTCYTLLTDEAHTALTRHLLLTLVRVSARVLNLEFAIFRLRAGTYSTPGRILGPSEKTPSRDQYHDYLEKLLAGGTGGSLYGIYRAGASDGVSDRSMGGDGKLSF